MTLRQGQGVVVVDASAAVPFLEGESAWVERWRAWIAGGDLLLAPPHFPVEVANVLLRGSKVVSAPDVPELIDELYASGFETADRGHAGMRRALGLAERHGLTVDDAAYLDLAIDVDGALATQDRSLRRAAEAEGVLLAS